MKINFNNKTEIVNLFLLDKRVNLNKQDNYGWTGLHWACENGNTNLVKLILESGKCDLNIKTTEDYGYIKSGSTALDIAKQKNFQNIIQLFANYKKQG